MVATTLRIRYDAVLGDLATRYRLGSGRFAAYPLESGGSPAPVVDPLIDWMLDPDDALDIVLMFSATRAAVSEGEASEITSDLALLPGDVWFDDLVVTATPMPEPPATTAAIAALPILAQLARHRRSGSEQPSSGRREGDIWHPDEILGREDR